MVQQAAQDGTRIDRVEHNLWNRLLGIGHIALDAYIYTQGTGDLGPTLPYEGQELKRLKGLYHRRYFSVFAELNIPHTVYGRRPNQKLDAIPLENRLGLPESDRVIVDKRMGDEPYTHDSKAEIAFRGRLRAM